MGLTTVALALGIVISYLRGGRLGRLVDSDLKVTWMLVTGFALQASVDWASEEGYLGDALGLILLQASFVLLLGWFAINRHMRGSVLLFIGFALNAIVIAANGAMPVDVEAIRAAGVTDPVIPFGKHEILTAHTALPWLADRFPIVAIRSSISIGDIVLAAGTIPLTHDLMTSRSAPDRRRALRRPAQAGAG